MFPAILLCMGIAAGCLLAGRILLHYFQLESYQFPGYFRTVRRNLLKAIMPGVCMMILLMIAVTVIRAVMNEAGQTVLSAASVSVIMTAGGIIVGYIFSEKHVKKKFVITSRVKRLYAVSFAVLTVMLLVVSRFMSKEGGNNHTAAAVILIFPALLPLWTAFCGLLAWPVEKLISELYFRDAQKILRSRPDLIRIGITGSWGKTSVKFILGTILEQKYHTLITPASYNTPMGVTKVIRSKLEPGHRVFIAEMGARHVGDIKEMCRLVHPQTGIITSVGPQHLDTFKTVERVAQTKYELIQSLPEDGEAFFSDDGGICRELYERTEIKKHLTGLDSGLNEVWAENICYTPEGSAFRICRKNEEAYCTTRLLGELNIRNILLCAAVAFSLGMTMEQVVRGIARLTPVEHRLQLIRHPGGLNVIDDAFNSNIRGAEQAFRVIREFPERRIIVTPGMVELGSQEYDMNRKFGTLMADCCDYAVLIGKKRSEAIAEGLRDKGFPEKAIIIVSTLEEATGVLKGIARSGDTVLFENDLPDNYTEA